MKGLEKLEEVLDRLQDTLNGGYNGLYGEVVTEDAYQIKKIDFTPSCVIDLGGNIGIFARYARTLFPEAKIVSVEPDKGNCEVFRRFTHDENIILIEKAIGIGKIWRCEQEINGAHESYLSSGLGFPFVVGEPIPKINETNVEAIMPSEIIDKYVSEGERFIVKIDIEASENIIWGHQESMDALKKADYLCMEIHQSAFTKELIPEVRRRTFEALASFIPTHYCEYAAPLFYATKR